MNGGPRRDHRLHRTESRYSRGFVRVSLARAQPQSYRWVVTPTPEGAVILDGAAIGGRKREPLEVAGERFAFGLGDGLRLPLRAWGFRWAPGRLGAVAGSHASQAGSRQRDCEGSPAAKHSHLSHERELPSRPWYRRLVNLRIALIAAPILLAGLACDADLPDGYADEGEEEGDGDGDNDEGEPEPEPEPTCLPTDQPHLGSVTLSNNADVEALAGYSVVQGNIGVHWGVTDLSGLTCLTEVTGGFWIVDNNVASLSPLANLVEVGGELEIGMTHVLAEIMLPALAEVGTLSVYNNDILTNLELPQLATIQANAEVDDNLELPTCDVTTVRDALTYQGGMFYISNNLPGECEG
jgi:hypothetical protein